MSGISYQLPGLEIRPPEAVMHEVRAGEYRRDFRLWVLKNWHLFRAFEGLVDDWRRAGNTHCGAKMIFEVMRYQTGINQVHEEHAEWNGKLNNNFTADCARLYEFLHPSAAGLFERRNRDLPEREAA